MNATAVGRVFSRVCLLVCLFVRNLKGKRLELSTPNLVHAYSVAAAQHAIIQRSKIKVTRLLKHHGRTVSSDVCCSAVAGMGLHVNTTAYAF